MQGEDVDRTAGLQRTRQATRLALKRYPCSSIAACLFPKEGFVIADQLQMGIR